MTEQLVVVVVVVLIIGLGILAKRSNGSSTARRAADRERALATPVDPEALAEIRQHLAAQRKIQAVKRIREATRLGLADAVALVEAIAAGHQPPTPAATPDSGAPTSPAGAVRPDAARRGAGDRGDPHGL